MGRALMDISYDKFRHAALTMTVRAYKPHVPVDSNPRHSFAPLTALPSSTLPCLSLQHAVLLKPLIVKG